MNLLSWVKVLCFRSVYILGKAEHNLSTRCPKTVPAFGQQQNESF